MPAAIRHNAYTENIGTDWVAIDHVGNPVARAGDEETVRRAAPTAERYLTSVDLYPPKAPPKTPAPAAEPAAEAPKDSEPEPPAAEPETPRTPRTRRKARA